MPVYAFKCDSCGVVLDFERRLADAAVPILKRCELCNTYSQHYRSYRAPAIGRVGGAGDSPSRKSVDK